MVKYISSNTYYYLIDNELFNVFSILLIYEYYSVIIIIIVLIIYLQIHNFRLFDNIYYKLRQYYYIVMNF